MKMQKGNHNYNLYNHFVLKFYVSVLQITSLLLYLPDQVFHEVLLFLCYTLSILHWSCHSM